MCVNSWDIKFRNLKFTLTKPNHTMQPIAIQSSSAFSGQLTKEISSLRKFARQFTSDHQTINDLVQDTLIKALRYYQQFQNGTSLKAWLFVIMRNTYRNNYKKNLLKQATFNFIEEISASALQRGSSQNMGESRFIQQDISQAMKKLSQKLYLPIKLFSLGYKYCEIASQTGVPIGTVKTRIHLGRIQLKQLLSDYNYA
ncbi:RNA polymerase sigma factor [Pedobacter panaciterrae]